MKIEEMEASVKNTDKKVFVISHDDLDGAGCILVIKRVFANVDYIQCSIRTLDETIYKLFFNKSKDIDINSYDYIFITDLCPSMSVINKLYNEKKTIFKKLYIVDHHETNLNNLTTYIENSMKEVSAFMKKHVHIKPYDSKGVQNSGSNLLLTFLCKHKEIVDFQVIDGGDNYFRKFIRAVRLWDTFDWVDINPKTGLREDRAQSLNFVYNFFCNNNMVDSFIEEKDKVFTECAYNLEEPFDFFNEGEKDIIDDVWITLWEDYNRLSLGYTCITIDSDKFADILVDQDSKSYKEIKADLTKKNSIIALSVGVPSLDADISSISLILFDKYKVDVIIFTYLDNFSTSFRARRNSPFVVNKLAELFNGGGHPKASGCQTTINSNGTIVFNRLNNYTKNLIPIDDLYERNNEDRYYKKGINPFFRYNNGEIE